MHLGDDVKVENLISAKDELSGADIKVIIYINIRLCVLKLVY